MKKKAARYLSLLLTCLLMFGVLGAFAYAQTTYTITIGTLDGNVTQVTADEGDYVLGIVSAYATETGSTWYWSEGDVAVDSSTTVTANMHVYEKAAAATTTYTITIGTLDGNVTQVTADEGDTVLDIVSAYATETGSTWYWSEGDVAVDSSTTVSAAMHIYEVAHVHTYDEGTVTTEATCTTDGVMTYTCTVCGATYTETIEATGHTYGEPTFTWSDDYSTATATYTCSVCGDTQTVDATVTSVSTAATTTEDGSIVYTASITVDGVEYTATKTVTVQATGTDDDSSTTTTDDSTSTTTSTDSTSDTSSTTSGKTGVEDNLLFYALAAIAAMGIIVVAADRKKSR